MVYLLSQQSVPSPAGLLPFSLFQQRPQARQTKGSRPPFQQGRV